MLKKLSFSVLFLFLLCGVVMASVGIQNNGTYLGAATTLNVTAGISSDGSNATLGPTIEASTTNDTLTATESGKVFIVTPATTTPTYTLPTAASNLHYTFVSANGTKKLIIDPQSTDTFVGCVNSSSTTTFAAGDSLISAGGTGDSLEIYGAPTKWYCTYRVGTWVDNN